MFALPIIFNVVLIGLIGFKTLDLKFEVLFLFFTVTLFSTATWSLLLMTGGIDGFRVWLPFMISYVVAGILGIFVWKIKKKTPRNYKNTLRAAKGV